MSGALAGDRYVVISADTHGGATMDTYRQYLEAEYLDEYDAWARSFEYPFKIADVQGGPGTEIYRKNYDFEVRVPDLEAEGVVGEIIYPNTVPPFFSTALAFVESTPGTAAEVGRRWAGLRVHNRWLADFCAELPGRRAGIAQVWLHDIDEALAEIRRVREAGIFGGVLLPIPPPASPLPQLAHERYEPVWALCEDLDLPVHTHGGGGSPIEPEHQASGAVLFVEGFFWTARVLGQLIFSGVFERHPRLKFAITENGNTWVPHTLRHYDCLYDQMRTKGSIQWQFGGPVCEKLPRKPSDYWATNCWQGNSFMGPEDCALRYGIGVDNMMWGNDYPHYEATSPHTREALHWTFQGVDPDEVQKIIGGNAAKVFGFDLDLLIPLAEKLGPSVQEILKPMDASELPEDDHCNVFAQKPQPVGRVASTPDQLRF
jgi:predicted TIM-barrel fold metal-dependent hydrolase